MLTTEPLLKTVFWVCLAHISYHLIQTILPPLRLSNVLQRKHSTNVQTMRHLWRVCLCLQTSPEYDDLQRAAGTGVHAPTARTRGTVSSIHPSLFWCILFALFTAHWHVLSELWLFPDIVSALKVISLLVPSFTTSFAARFPKSAFTWAKRSCRWTKAETESCFDLVTGQKQKVTSLSEQMVRIVPFVKGSMKNWRRRRGSLLVMVRPFLLVLSVWWVRLVLWPQKSSLILSFQTVSSVPLLAPIDPSL